MEFGDGKNGALAPFSRAGVTIDLSRLFFRLRHGTPSGIDRVELAYARHYLGQTRRRPRFLVRLGLAGAWEIRAQRVERLLSDVEEAWYRGQTPPFAALWSGSLPHLSPYLAKPNEITVIPSHSNWHRPQWLRSRRDATRRLVVFLHDTIPSDYPCYARKGGAERHLQRLSNAIAHADGFIVNSTETARSLARYAERQSPAAINLAERIAIAPIGCRTAATRPMVAPPVPTDRPYFLTVGTIEPRKNHLLLLHVWRRLAQTMPDIAPRLVIVGRRGWENEMVLDMLDRCTDLGGLVIERNALGDAELDRLMAGASALLMPSFAEGFGMPVSEALARGVPVVASDLPVYRETAGDLPYYLDPLDGPGWMRAVLALATRPAEDHAHWQERAGEWVPPSWHDHFRQVEALLERLEA